MKIVKLQRLNSNFEEIRMEKDETFDGFYAKLEDIVNSAFNLGEFMAKSKIVRKFLRSLLERFHTKITAIEEAKDIIKIHLTKLVGNLQTYEIGSGKIGKSGKSRSMALKGIKEESDNYEDDDEVATNHAVFLGVIGHLTLFDFIIDPRLRKMSFFLI